MGNYSYYTTANGVLKRIPDSKRERVDYPLRRASNVITVDVKTAVERYYHRPATPKKNWFRRVIERIKRFFLNF
jgi:hypothetical protein